MRTSIFSIFGFVFIFAIISYFLNDKSKPLTEKEHHKIERFVVEVTDENLENDSLAQVLKKYYKKEYYKVREDIINNIVKKIEKDSNKCNKILNL